MTQNERDTINAAAAIITAELNDDGDKVIIKGFGTFKRAKQNARTARNPQSGEAIEVPAKSVVKFKASKGLSTTY